MISRIDKILGVGRFIDYKGSNKLLFGNNTLIFGQNATGKSTITDILWSLKTGQSFLIEGRRSFGYIGKQEVIITTDNSQKAEFPGDEWAAGKSDIEIFDARFINENIFEGSIITYEHQRNLHSVIIGEKGAILSKEITALQDEISELSTRKRAMTSEFNSEFNKDITVAEFRKLPPDEHAEEIMADLQATIENARNQENVKKIFDTLDVYLSNIIRQDTKQILSQTFETTAEKVQTHIQNTWKDPRHSRDFLQTGLSLTKSLNDDCVFCGQPHNADSKELLSAYGKLFSDEYRNLQTAINNSTARFAKWNPVTYTETIVDKLASIRISLKSPASLTPEVIRQLKSKTETAFEQKAKDMSIAVSFTEYDQLIRYFEGIKTELDGLRLKHVHTEPVDLGELNRKRRQIEISAQRYSPHWIGFMKEYDQLDGEQDSRKEIRDYKRDQLNTYSEQLFNLHLDTINKILKQLQADFTICDFQPMKKLVGKSERIFALEFFNRHQVNLAQEDQAFPSFNTTLSDSDKRVLAFAFFYSMLMHDPELDKKIVIFDDPFSSFDTDRRKKTAELLTNPYMITDQGEMIEKEFGQLIVLTHEAGFYIWLYQQLSSATTLAIVSDGELNGVRKSMLSELDMLVFAREKSEF